jgi:predicted AAA+ superfamily ATPase
MIGRNITQALLDALSDSPVVLLNGARQTGKSTLAQHLADEQYPARYLTLDDATVLTAARQDPSGFVSNLEKPIVLDEVQRAPELFPAIKAEVDRRRRPGQFLLTGSANVLLLPRLSESLVGRLEILTLWPFSQGELEETKASFVDALFASSPSSLASFADKSFGKDEIVQRIQVGGYPEAVARKAADRRAAWFQSYVTTLVHRDVRDLANIEHLTLLPRLLSLLAARATALLNFTELSRSLGLPQSTLKRYMALLEMTFLYQPLSAWSANLGKRLVKAPKIMLNDTGLITHLLDLKPERLESEPQLFGPLLENFVVTEVRKQLGWSQTRPQLYHFRTQTGQEVDCLLEDAAGRVVGLEVKASSTIESRDLRGLLALCEAVGKRFHRGFVLYLGRESVPFGANVQAMPVSALWRLGVRK